MGIQPVTLGYTLLQRGAEVPSGGGEQQAPWQQRGIEGWSLKTRR